MKCKVCCKLIESLKVFREIFYFDCVGMLDLCKISFHCHEILFVQKVKESCLRLLKVFMISRPNRNSHRRHGIFYFQHFNCKCLDGKCLDVFIMNSGCKSSILTGSIWITQQKRNSFLTCFLLTPYVEQS